MNVRRIGNEENDDELRLSAYLKKNKMVINQLMCVLSVILMSLSQHTDIEYITTGSQWYSASYSSSCHRSLSISR